MSSKTADDLVHDASAWWSTGIIDVDPGEIKIRGYPIQELIGELRFPEMIWLMLRGEVPTRAQATLLEAALVAAVDHGPHAPSIAISRMATIARAYGAEGVQIKSADEFKPAFERAIKSNRPVVIDVAMQNEPVPTGGHWNINDIYSPGREVSHLAVAVTID